MNNDILLAKEIENLSRRIRNIEIQLGGGGCGILIARYVRDSAQTINNGADTIIQYNTLYYDDSGVVTTGANWKFVAPQASYYIVVGGFSFQTSNAWSAGEYILSRIVVNAALYSESAKCAQAFVASGYRLGVQYADIVYLDVGDELRIEGNQNSGANLDLEADGDINFVSISIL